MELDKEQVLKRVLLLLVLVSLFGCRTSKESLFTDKSKTDTFTEKRTVTRAGDTVTIEIPNIRYKDTTITKINYDTKTIASVRYDSQGNQTFDCISAELKELIETMKQSTQNDIEAEAKRESEFNPQYIFYAIGFLAFIVFLGLGVLGFMFLKLQRQLPMMTTDIVNKLIK